jgi:hypothetical protein
MSELPTGTVTVIHRRRGPARQVSLISAPLTVRPAGRARIPSPGERYER